MSAYNLLLQTEFINPVGRTLMGELRDFLAQPIVHLVITTLLILLSALTISNENTEFISFIIWILLLSDPLIVHHILSPNKKETKQEGKPERIFPELDIPLPVTEENKDEYLAELDKISVAELWIDKHSADTDISSRDDRRIRDDITSEPAKTGKLKFFLKWIIGFPLLLLLIMAPPEYFAQSIGLVVIGLVIFAILKVGKTSYVGSDSHTFYYIVIAIISGFLIFLSIMIILLEFLNNPSTFIRP